MADDENLSRAVDRLELKGYQIRDRIEGEVWKSISQKVALVLGGLTVFGIVSVPLFFKYVSDRVTTDVGQQLNAETNRLRNQLTLDLADIDKRKVDLQIELKMAHADLSSLQQELSNAKTVSRGYDALRSKVEVSAGKVQDLQRSYDKQSEQLQKQSRDFQKSLERFDNATTSARRVAEESQQSTVSLQHALVSSSLGQPSIFSPPPMVLGNVAGEIAGANFGKSRGHVYVRAAATRIVEDERIGTVVEETPVETAPIKLGDESVLGWQDNSIAVRLSTSVEKTVKDNLRTLLSSGNYSSFERYELQVETSDGKRSQWFYGGGLAVR